jgi:uncharacterized protein YeaO (DUF488 family)
MSSTVRAANVRLRRAYTRADPRDGRRILVDRLWPRGIRKDEARLDEWVKQVAPSTELRTWFGHDPRRWDEFRRRYRAELKHHSADVSELRRQARGGPITLVFSASDEEHNDAVVLRNVILGRPQR